MCKQRAIISHVGRAIVNFVLKFVAMTTGFGRGEIKMTPSDSLGPKIRGRCKQRAIVFYRGPSYRAYRFEIPIGRYANF